MSNPKKEERKAKGGKNLTTAFGIPVADNQNVMTAGPRFYAQKIVQRSSSNPSNLPLSPKSIDKSANINQKDGHRSTIFIAERCINSDNQRRKNYERR